MELYQTIEAKKKVHQNLGIQLLRTILCFWVVCFHCLSTKNKLIKNIVREKAFHVPTFMLISFYFLSNKLYEKNINKIKQRFERLLMPYLIWPFIIWIINNLLYVFLKFNRFNKILSINNLFIQLIVGRKYHGIFWFKFNLIFLTLFSFIISFLFKKNLLFLFQIIGIISYFLQYSNYNYDFFFKYKDSISHSIGYFCEIIPNAVAGLTLSKINAIEKLLIYRKKTLFFSIIIIFSLFRYNIFKDLKGLRYRGVISNFGAIFLFISFSLIPFIYIKNKTIINIINNFTKYTEGIYCLHFQINYYLKIKISLVKNNSIVCCIIIYLLSYLISFIGIKIFGKTKFKYLFI